MNSNYTGPQTRDNLQIENTSTTYICGSCGSDNEIRPRENIVCKDCNGRIFYKKRTRRLVQYEAR